MQAWDIPGACNCDGQEGPMPTRADVLKLTDGHLKVAFAVEVAMDGVLLKDYTLDTVIQHVKEWCGKQGNWLFVFYWDNRVNQYHALVGEDDSRSRGEQREAHEATHDRLDIALMRAAVMAAREE